MFSNLYIKFVIKSLCSTTIKQDPDRKHHMGTKSTHQLSKLYENLGCFSKYTQLRRNQKLTNKSCQAFCANRMSYADEDPSHLKKSFETYTVTVSM